MKPPAHRTFKCTGCGAVAGVLLESSGAGPAGSVFHTKPDADANKRPVQCTLYQQLSARAFAALHEDQPSLEQATNWEKA